MNPLMSVKILSMVGSGYSSHLEDFVDLTEGHDELDEPVLLRYSETTSS